MSGAIPLLPLNASIAWSGITLLLRCGGHFCARKPLAKSTVLFTVHGVLYSAKSELNQGSVLQLIAYFIQGNPVLTRTEALTRQCLVVCDDE